MKYSKIPLVIAAVSLLGVGYVAVGQKKKAQSQEEKITAAIPDMVAKPLKKRKMLVFSVTRGYRHGSIGIGKKAFKILGDETGAYETVVSDDLANFEADKIKDFDAICFLNTTMEVFLPSKGDWEKLDEAGRQTAEETDARLKKNLLAFIKNGGGFVGIHAASDTFYKWPEYGVMLGGYFDGHPWRHNTDVSIKVDQGKEKHAIVAGLNGKSLDFREEIYQMKEPYDSSKLNVLMRLDTEKSDMKVGGVKRKDKDFGVTWIKPYGKGRVFYCSLGHNDHIYSNTGILSVYLNGIQWALGDLKID